MLDTVRARLAAWYAGVFGVMLVLCGAGVYAFVAAGSHARVEASMRAFAEAAERSLRLETAEGESFEEAAESTANELNLLPEQTIAIFSEEGRLLAERGASRAGLTANASNDAVRNGHRVAVEPVTVSGRHYVVSIGHELGGVEADLAVLRRVLLGTVPVAVAIAALAGWILARRALAPVALMSDRAARIGTHSLDDRLPVVNRRDELGQLALTFNGLLDRLSAGLGQQRQFMADASHELRTPLSVIATAADVTLERGHRDEPEYREALAIVQQETHRLRQMVDDMFTLARADAGQQMPHRSALYLDEVLLEAVRAARVLAAQKQVDIRLAAPGDASYTGDEPLLLRLLQNLLDNAVRHSPPGSAVDVTLANDDAGYLIRVRDSGRGIPVDAQRHVFERFYQADAARTAGEGGRGAGLGLPIARWIAEAHGGSLILQDTSSTGSTFAVRLPLAITGPPGLST